MIRINLLPQEKGRAKRRESTGGSDAGQKITVAATLVVVLAGLGVAWWYRAIQKNAQRINEETVAAEQETMRLRTIISQVQQFETRKSQLQQRVTLIEQLRKGQSGPVHMLDQLSRSMPDTMWLTEIAQKGSELTIDGRCSALTSLSDYVNNLENSGWFKKPVEIVDTAQDRPQGTDVELIRFRIRATFTQPGN
jgi:type IV pilus assembly protein PilN